MVLCFVIGIGLILGKIKFKGVSLGPIWVLFVGILVSALGVKADSLFLHFIKEFGLILYVYIIGFQVGPSFFNSFRREGLKFNLLSLMMVSLVVLMTLGLWSISSESLPRLVGTMSGAVTNTPGMGTAQQTWYDAVYGTFLAEVDSPGVASEIANSFAIVYPIGLIVALLVIMLLRLIFKVDPAKEAAALRDENPDQVKSLAYAVNNPAVVGKNLSEVLALFEGKYTVTGIVRPGKSFTRADDPVLQMGDIIHVDMVGDGKNTLRLCFGNELLDSSAAGAGPAATAAPHHIMITKASLTGKKLRDLDLEKKYGVSVVRVLRSGMELVPQHDMYIQMGDGLLAVGGESGIAAVSELVGNKDAELEKPNLIPVFIGIGLGLILGAVPMSFPGISNAVHLGLAAGPLIAGIIIGHFGPRWKISTYSSASALRMVREMGLYLLLATIGLGAGPSFGSVFMQSGWHILLYGSLIALVPMLITGLFARFVMHQNFIHICGLISGASTNPLALEFVRQRYGTEAMSVAYAAVYPFALFLQVFAAQLLILIAV